MVNFASYLGKAELETHEMLRTDFSDSAIGSTWTFDWFCHFRHRGTSVEDDEHSGYSSLGCTDRSMEEVCKIISEDWQVLFCRSLAGEASYVKHASEV